MLPVSVRHVFHLGKPSTVNDMPRRSLFSWPVRVSQGLAEELETVSNLTAEEVRAELAKPERERSDEGRRVTGVLRDMWNEGELAGLVVYSHGRLRLRDEQRKRPSGAQRRKAQKSKRSEN